MQHPNIDLVAGLYQGYGAGDVAVIQRWVSPGQRWHSSGTDETSGTFEGLPAVLEHLFGGNHMDDYQLEVIDMLASDERVAVVARSRGSRGEHRFELDFVQILRISQGKVVEVWDYKWDQQAAAAFSAIPWETAS